jgi:hypothetical protein
MFARSTTVCPRCNRTNDRNPLVIGFKLAACMIFIASVIFVMRAVMHVSAATLAEPVTPLPTPAPATSDDVRF